MHKTLRTAGSIVWLCAVLSAAAPHKAAACSRMLLPPFQIDPSQQLRDSTPPTPFTELTATTLRVNGTHCSGTSCSSTSCGDGAGLTLKFMPPTDDQNAVAELGYRVVWLQGPVPVSMQAAIDKVQPLRSASQINIEFGFDEITALDGELMLIAVDRAGNESAASAPIHVEFSGCTKYFDEPGCIESSCSVPPVLRGSSVGAAWWWVPLSAFVLAARLRYRRRSRCTVQGRVHLLLWSLVQSAARSTDHR
jgi:hypothetical protein